MRRPRESLDLLQDDETFSQSLGFRWWVNLHCIDAHHDMIFYHDITYSESSAWPKREQKGPSKVILDDPSLHVQGSVVYVWEGQFKGYHVSTEDLFIQVEERAKKQYFSQEECFASGLLGTFDQIEQFKMANPYSHDHYYPSSMASIDDDRASPVFPDLTQHTTLGQNIGTALKSAHKIHFSSALPEMRITSPGPIKPNKAIDTEPGESDSDSPSHKNMNLPGNYRRSPIGPQRLFSHNSTHYSNNRISLEAKLDAREANLLKREAFVKRREVEIVKREHEFEQRLYSAEEASRKRDAKLSDREAILRACEERLGRKWDKLCDNEVEVFELKQNARERFQLLEEVEEINGFLRAKLEPVCQCIRTPHSPAWGTGNVIRPQVQLRYPVWVTVIGKDRKDKAVRVLSITGIPTEANVARTAATEFKNWALPFGHIYRIRLNNNCSEKLSKWASTEAKLIDRYGFEMFFQRVGENTFVRFGPMLDIIFEPVSPNVDISTPVPIPFASASTGSIPGNGQTSKIKKEKVKITPKFPPAIAGLARNQQKPVPEVSPME